MSEFTPVGWEKKRLSELLTVPAQTQELTPDRIELLTVKLHGKGVVKSGKFPKNNPKGRPYFRRYAGELLIGRQNLHNCGLGIVPPEADGMIASNAISSFVSNGGELQFMLQFLSFHSFQNYVHNLASGTGQKELSEKEFLALRVLVPPLAEQRKIAAVLASVDEVMACVHKQINKLQDLKQATMNQLLSMGVGHATFKDSKLGMIPDCWEVKTLDELGKFSKGKGVSKSETISEGIPCIRYAEIYTHYDFQIKEFKSFISRETARLSKKLAKNDIIFAGSGETAECIGKSVAFTLDCEAYAGGDAIIFSPLKKLDSLFLAYQLNGEFCVKQLMKFGQGSSIVHIYSSDLRKVLVCMPPLSEQRKIAAILSSMDNTIEEKQRKLRKLQSLKNALMQDLLTGKVRT